MKEKAVFTEPAKVTPFRANSKRSYSFHHLPYPCNNLQFTALSTSSEIAATAGISLVWEDIPQFENIAPPILPDFNPQQPKNQELYLSSPPKISLFVFFYFS